MSDERDTGRAMTDEERARALRDQMKSLHTFDLAYEMMVSLITFGYEKLGLTEQTAELRDLGDAHFAIELFHAVLDVVDREHGDAETHDLRSTLAQMQLGYVRAVESAGERGKVEATEERGAAEPAAGEAAQDRGAAEPASGEPPAVGEQPPVAGSAPEESAEAERRAATEEPSARPDSGDTAAARAAKKPAAKKPAAGKAGPKKAAAGKAGPKKPAAGKAGPKKPARRRPAQKKDAPAD